MVTQNLRFSCFIAKASDRGFAVEDGMTPMPFGEANIRRVEIIDRNGFWISATVIEWPNGSYELYVAQPIPVIDADVDFVEAVFKDSRSLIHKMG